MNLDDVNAFESLDSQHLIKEIDGIPDQLAAAWDLGNSLPLPAWEGISQVLIAGMGDSAHGADLLAAYAAPIASVPVIVHRDYGLPAWAQRNNSLVIISSYSGDTEEALSVYQAALASECCLLVISTGGKLIEKAKRDGIPYWQYEHDSQTSAAIGFSFGLLLAIFSRLGLIPDTNEELAETIDDLKAQQRSLGRETPTMQNPAKRLAGQCFGRIVAVFGSDHLEPVARRWVTQINEIAKAWAQFEALPEANHNLIAGVGNPETLLSNTMLLFLRAHGCHPRNKVRTDLTKEYFMLEGMGTDFFNAMGASRMSQMWTTLHFGDYLAYYLAMAYGVDPMPAASISGMKEYLQEMEP